jgi:hypothetical protein
VLAADMREVALGHHFGGVYGGSVEPEKAAFAEEKPGDIVAWIFYRIFCFFGFFRKYSLKSRVFGG